jgi:uncharacterized protein
MPSNSTSNPFLLAADGSSELVPLLRSQPSLLNQQDEHGYSLLHALTSYSHIELLRAIHSEFKFDPATVDEDGETALYVSETVEVARLLVEEIGIDPSHRNDDGQTAEEKIREEGEFVAVSDFLKETRIRQNGGAGEGQEEETESIGHPPPLPSGVRIDLGTMQEGDVQQEPDEGFRRRIEELAARDDFTGEQGQRELRELVRDAVRDVGAVETNTRRRVD